MGFWNKYPMTNFHELNLDWILGKIKELDYTVKHWIKEITPIITETVNDWLNDHPEATTTVTDGSITIDKFNSNLKNGFDKYTIPYISDDLTKINWGEFVVIPQMFGAKGDGVTDDTNAIQSAIDYINSKNVGVVYIPNGTYLVSSTLHTVYGGSKSTSFVLDRYAIIKANAVMDCVFNIGANYDGNRPYENRGALEKEMFRGGCIDGNQLAKCGIKFTNFRGYTLKDVSIYNCTEKGIWTLYSGFYNESFYTSEFTANNLNISNKTGNTAYGIYLESPDVKLSNIHIFGSKFAMYTLNAVYAEEIHATISSETDYAGSVCFYDRSAHMSSYTDCYCDTYETSYKLDTSVNITGGVTYFWMTEAQIENHSSIRPRVFDCSGMPSNGYLSVTGYKCRGAGLGQKFQYLYMPSTKNSEVVYAILQNASIDGFYTSCPIDFKDFINGTKNYKAGVLSGDSARNEVQVDKYLLLTSVYTMSGYKNFFIDAIYNEGVGADTSAIPGRVADHVQIYFGSDTSINSLSSNSVSLNVDRLGGNAGKYVVTVAEETYSGRVYKVYRIYIKAGLRIRGPFNYSITGNIYNGFFNVENNGFLSDSTVSTIPIIVTTPTGTVVYTET